MRRLRAPVPVITKVRYTEIRSGADGVSYFADCELEIAAGEVAPGMAPMGRSATYPATGFAFVAAAPGWEGGWHNPPADGFVCVLAGTFRIETGDGRCAQLRAGRDLAPPRCDRAGAQHPGDRQHGCAVFAGAVPRRRHGAARRLNGGTTWNRLRS